MLLLFLATASGVFTLSAEVYHIIGYYKFEEDGGSGLAPFRIRL